MNTKYCRKCGEPKTADGDNFCESCTKQFKRWLSEVDYRVSQNITAFSYPKHHPIFQPQIKILRHGGISVNDNEAVF